MPLQELHSRAFPFPLYTFTIQLLLQSTGTTPLLTTSLQISVTHFTSASPAAFNISVATPDGPAALPLFALPIASLTQRWTGPPGHRAFSRWAGRIWAARAGLS